MMKKVFSVVLLFLLIAIPIGIWRAYKQSENRNLATKECESLRAKVESKMDLNAEKSRLETMGLEVGLFPGSQGEEGMMLVSSSTKRGQDSVSCALKVSGGVLKSVIVN